MAAAAEQEDGLSFAGSESRTVGGCSGLGLGDGGGGDGGGGGDSKASETEEKEEDEEEGEAALLLASLLTLRGACERAVERCTVSVCSCDSFFGTCCSDDVFSLRVCREGWRAPGYLFLTYILSL